MTWSSKGIYIPAFGSAVTITDKRGEELNSSNTFEMLGCIVGVKVEMGDHTLRDVVWKLFYHVSLEPLELDRGEKLHTKPIVRLII